MIWAAIDLLKGRCVQLTGGDPQSARFVRDPIEAARHWLDQGAEGLHIIDLDGALGEGSNQLVIEKILKLADVPTQIGGGIRGEAAISRWMESGADRVIVGTRGIEEPDWLAEMATKYPDRVVLALDTKGGRLAVRGWRVGLSHELISFAKSVEHLPLAGFLYTNIDVEGSLSGVDRSQIEAVCASTSKPLIVSGGIGAIHDVKEAFRAGAAGVVIGTALYSGDIRLPELRKELGYAEPA